jgi:tRNA(fMet)-specific endonuclease VapC
MVSALMKGDARVVARLKAVSKSSVYVPQPVIAEICYGIERLPKSKRRAFLQGRFDLICSELQKMPWTDDVSMRFGNIKAALEKRGQRLEDFDIAIAAHADADSTLVTANTDDMVRVPGVKIENWAD